MVTDYRDAFSADGEGPVRTVTLSPFHVDTYPVTNRDFAAFVEATGYRTDAERFEWSFVFWMHLPPDRLDELIEDTVAAAPWWCKVPGSSWQHVMPRTATVTAGRTYLQHRRQLRLQHRLSLCPNSRSIKRDRNFLEK